MGEVWFYCKSEHSFPSEMGFCDPESGHNATDAGLRTNNRWVLLETSLCARREARRCARFPHLINERSFPSFPFRSVPFLRFPSLSFPVLSFPFLSLLTKTLDNLEQSSVRLMTFEPNKPNSMRIPTLAIQTCNGAYHTSKGKPCAHHGKKGRLSNTSFCHQSISRAHYKETTVSKEGTT